MPRSGDNNLLCAESHDPAKFGGDKIQHGHTGAHMFGAGIHMHMLKCTMLRIYGAYGYQVVVCIYIAWARHVLDGFQYLNAVSFGAFSEWLHDNHP